MKLKSKRVYLRTPKADDCDALIELYRRSRKLFGVYSRSEFNRERFEMLLLESAKETNESFLVCTVNDEKIVGTLNLSQIFRKSFQNAYLGYQLFAGYTGNGYMTEAVALGLKFAFIELGLHRVEANVQPANKPSIGVLRRNNFVKEGFSRRYLKLSGRWRDHERWAILKEDWLENKNAKHNSRK